VKKYLPASNGDRCAPAKFLLASSPVHVRLIMQRSQDSEYSSPSLRNAPICRARARTREHALPQCRQTFTCRISTSFLPTERRRSLVGEKCLDYIFSLRITSHTAVSAFVFRRVARSAFYIRVWNQYRVAPLDFFPSLREETMRARAYASVRA